MVYATEAVQNRQECVGKVTADLTDVCVPKVAGVVQVGVQLVQLVGAVLRQIIGAQQNITATAVSFVTDVQTVGTVKDMAEI